MSRIPRWAAAALTLAVLVPLGGGVSFYHVEKRHLHAEAGSDLEAIARLKVDQIAEWRAERLGDANVLMDSQFLVEGVARWVAAGAAEDEKGILARFRSVSDNYHYSDVLLLDPAGQVLLSLSGRIGALHEDATQAVASAVRDRRPVLTDLHAGPGDLPPHLDVIAPLFATNGTARPIGAILLRCEARHFLYPLIQSWPTESRTAETLLVRRDGDDVLFLNDLRHEPDTALKLRIPITRADLPAAMAVTGREGMIEGRDYRGVRVLAVGYPIPDSPWYMIAKVDVAEALAGWRFAGVLITLLTTMLIVAATAAVSIVWQRNAKAHYRALYKAEAALRRSEERHAATLMSVGDGVIAADTDGRVELFNPVAEALTGWTSGEARGQPLDQVFRIANEETGEAVESPVARVTREGTVVGLANHTVLIARDGTERHIADSGAPVRDADGNITGVVLVFRDQTEQRAAERALRESEERFRAAFEQAAIGMSMTAPDGRLLRVNQAFCDMLGRTMEDAVASGWAQLTHPDDLSASRERVGRLLAGQESVLRSTKRYLHKDGHAVWVDVSTVLVRTDDGEPLQLITQAQDITERKRAEEALREPRNYLENLFNYANAPIIVWDPGFTITRFNAAFEHLTGIPAGEAVGRRLDILFPPDSRESSMRLVRQAWAGESWQVVEIAILHRSGETRTVLWNSANVLEPDGRTVAATIAQGHDITERTLAEEALRRSEAGLVRAQTLARMGSWELDLASDTATWSPGMYRLLGRAETYQPTTEGFAEFLHPEDRHIPRETLSRVRETGEPVDEELRTDPADGPVRYLASHIELVCDSEGRPVRIVGTVQDITARWRADEEKDHLRSQLVQAQKMESVGRLAGGVAHDFNNSLQAIIGFSDLALGIVEADSTLHRYLEEMRKAAMRSADLTRQLLAFARKQAIAPKTLDLNDTVSGMLRMLRRLIGEDIDLAWLPGHDLWHVKVDPSQIDQILANLAVNARDAVSGVGKVTIETANATFDEAYCADHLGFTPGEYVRLAVSDDGRGMDKETLDQVFEPFFTTKGFGEGTGLGLSTVYGIVRQNDGFINVYSEPGKGSTFAVYFPRHEADAVDQLAERESGPPMRGTETVLMVEDDIAILDLVQSILEGLGYTVLAANTPSVAMQLAREHSGKIDLLISDVVMPKMSGKDLAELLTTIRPGLKCLYMSGYTANVIAHRGILDEGVAFIQKPFSIEALAAKIREVLEA